MPETPTPRNADAPEARRAQAAGNHEALHGEAVRELNFGSSVPLSQRQAAMVQEQTKTAASWSDVIAEFKNKDWKQALKTLFALIFGGKHAVEGLGFIAKNAEQIPLRERAGLMAQLEHQRQSAPFKDRLIGSVLRYEVERSLLKQGYARERGAMSTTEPKQASGNNPVPLRSLLSPEAIAQMEAKDGEGKQILLGALPLDTMVPAGSFVYLDEHGLPLFLSLRKLAPAERPTVPLYVKRRKERREARGKLDEGVEFLEQSLEPGDVLVVSQGGQGETVGHEFFEVVQRAKVNDDARFHGTHVIITDANRQLLHVNTKGVARESIRDMFTKNPYDAITVLRLRDEERVRPLLENAEERARTTRRYNTTGLASKAINPTVKTASKDACICTDFVSESLPELEGLGTPSDIAQSEHFQVRYSLELGKSTGAQKQP